MEVEITWGRTVRIWWAYAWRSFMALLGAMLAGFLVSALASFVAGIIGAPFDAFQNVAVVLSAILGLAISVVPMRLILGKRYGEFRLTLVKADCTSKKKKRETQANHALA